MSGKIRSYLWLGSILNYDGLFRYKGASPAATQWTKGLINELSNQNVNIEIFSVVWDSLFPKGKMFPGKNKFLDSKFNQKIIPYINIPFLRVFTISFFLKIRLKRLISSKTEPLVIINYNPTKYYCNAIIDLKKKCPNLIWINFVLDFEDPLKDNWLKFKKLTSKADGHVFVSWWGFENAPVNEKIHLDSGWSDEKCDEKCDEKNIKSCEIVAGKKVILYAGKMQDFGGLPVLINAIKLIKREDVIFEFYGKGVNSELEYLAKTDKRVFIKGFVSDCELNRACQNAFAFLSPQDISFTMNKLTFPSKILVYLKYRKPIISLFLPGISPEYRSILYSPAKDTAEEWSKVIENVLCMTSKELEEKEQDYNLLLERKRWSNQANKLLNFIDDIIASKA